MAAIEGTEAGPVSAKTESAFKVASKWASLIKDVLSSVKDLGIICFVLALFLFREPVLQYLERTGMKVSKVNLLGGIELNIAALSGLAESEPRPLLESPIKADTTPSAVAAEPVPLPIPAQFEKIEKAVLAAPESRLVKDWAIVVAGYPQLDQAVAGSRLLSERSGRTATVFKKRNSFRLVVQLGDRDRVEDALRQVRSAVPASYLVSLASWCGEYKAENQYVLCSAQ